MGEKTLAFIGNWSKDIKTAKVVENWDKLTDKTDREEKELFKMVIGGQIFIGSERELDCQGCVPEPCITAFSPHRNSAGPLLYCSDSV